jgi:hypothetical protein
MKGVFWGIIIFSTLITAQSKKSRQSVQNLTCKTCHTCDVPTKQNPCLVECPREAMVTVHQPAEKGPDVVKLDKLVDKYSGINFSHKVHAQMAAMSGGCAGCHHYNTSGPIQPCSNCHEAKRIRGDLSRPDLQAAYHRQCITCHKEWSHTTDCNSCHTPKGTAVAKQKSNVKDHPAITGPDKLVYETKYNKGKLVTFSHNDHINLFGTECVSCHQKENCSRCHDKSKSTKPTSGSMPVKISKSASQHHQPCFKCHAEDPCSKCHMDKQAAPFNHKISTGWALNRFHEKLQCAKCHGSSNKFAKLNNNCVSCHKDFVTGSFNHAKTGLKLDEIHAELDCTDCHAENKFSNKPDCSNCHDDKSYPKEKPGVNIKIVKK